MRDSDVRGALATLLTEEHAQERADTLFVDELGLCGQVRVDVAVVNGALSGYELKSARDTLRRLPTQVEVYSRVLDYATLVVADAHAKHARQLLPHWWGVIEATSQGDSTILRTVNPSSMNPRIDPYSLAQLLWRDEVLAELTQRGLDVGVRGKPRVVLWERLASGVALDELRAIVRLSLKGRERWRSAR